MEEYTGFYSQEAYKLAEWAQIENNRVKASHLWKTAQRLEARYRNNHNNWQTYRPPLPRPTRPPYN